MPRLIFLRHGETEYTGQFPDLTPEGINNANKAGSAILKLIKEVGAKQIQIISSPTPRAKGTSSYIAKSIKYDKEIVEDENIRTFDLKDHQLTKDYWNSTGDSVVAAKNYCTDPFYETGLHMEKRSDTTARFVAFLKGLFWKATSDDCPDVIIVVSHFECLWKMVEKFKSEDPISFCELVTFDVVVRNEGVSVYGNFRGFSLDIDCELRNEIVPRLLC